MTYDFSIVFIIIMVVALPFAIPLIILKICNKNGNASGNTYNRTIPHVPEVLPTPPMPTYEEFVKQQGCNSNRLSANTKEIPSTCSPECVQEKTTNVLNETETKHEENITSEAAAKKQDKIVPAPENNETAPKEKKIDMTVSNILFLIGTAFIVLSGIAFGVASWVRTSHEGRVSIIAVAAAVAFALSWVFKKAIKLTGSSISFYVLGTGFSSTVFMTAGYYKLMGDWLSFSGEGCFMLLAITLAITSALMFLGNKIFDKLTLLYTALSAAALSILFTVFQIFDTLESAAPVLIVLQAVISALTLRPNAAKGKKYELPLKRIGLITSLVYGLTAVSYIISSVTEPTLSSYICISVIITQLVSYGIITEKKALISLESIASLILAAMISFTVTDTAPSSYYPIVFSTLAIILYALHRFIPTLKTGFTESITLTFSVLFGFISFTSAYDGHFIPEIIIGAIVSVIIASYVFSENNAINFTAGIAAPLFPIFITNSSSGYIRSAYNIQNTTVLNTVCWGILAFILITVTALLILRCDSKFNDGFTQDSILHSNMIVSGLILFLLTDYSYLIIIPLVLCIFHFAISNKFKCNYTALLSAASFIKMTIEIAKEFSDNTNLAFNIILLAVMVIYVVVSKLIYAEGIFTSTEKKVTMDPLFATAWLAILPLFGSERINLFFVLIASAVYTTGFIRKNTSYETASVILTISTIFTAFAFITRPFLVPDCPEISNKITVGIIALTGFISQIIWKKYKEAANIAANIIYILSFVSLLFDAIYFDTAANTIFVMSVMVFALVISIMARSKTWFITSASSLFVITVFATREYLTALNWWVYLFITGVTLIALAVTNEYCKKNNETLKSSIAKKFSGWNW